MDFSMTWMRYFLPSGNQTFRGQLDLGTGRLLPILELRREKRLQRHGGVYKEEPIHVSYGIDMEEHDNEGRVITCEYEFLPRHLRNSQRGLAAWTTAWNGKMISEIISICSRTSNLSSFAAT